MGQGKQQVLGDESETAGDPPIIYSQLSFPWSYILDSGHSHIIHTASSSDSGGRDNSSSSSISIASQDQSGPLMSYIECKMTRSQFMSSIYASPQLWAVRWINRLIRYSML